MSTDGKSYDVHRPKKNGDEPLYLKKEKSIRYSIRDGIFTSIKSGLTSNFVTPFAIALNASTGVLAIISSVPQLIASFFQLFAQGSLKIFKTRSRLIFLSALFQSFMWLPLIFIPLIANGNSTLAITLLLIFVVLEATMGTFQGPIYNSILGDIIDENKRGEFFGKRNMIVNFVGFVSTIAAGLILSFFELYDKHGIAHYVFFGFAILFMLAFIFRLLSSITKAKIYDPPYVPKKDNITFWGFLKNMTNNNYGIFVMYMFMFQLAANISAPFFALYLLRDMKMSYILYTLIASVSILTSFISMDIWGKVIDEHGSKMVLKITGFLVPFSPFLLVLAMLIKDPTLLFIYVFLEEAFSGVVWAGFNLSTSSFIFDATRKDERVKYNSYYTFMIGIAVFIGAMLGGMLIHIYPHWTIAATLVASAIPIIYLTTGTLRLLMTIIFIRRVQEARMIEIDFPGRGFFHSVLSIAPHHSNNITIIGEYHEKKQGDFHKILHFEKKEQPVKRRETAEERKVRERSIYERKSYEYYRDNALKTMNQGQKEYTRPDDSAKIEKELESDKAREISEMAEGIKKEQMKR